MIHQSLHRPAGINVYGSYTDARRQAFERGKAKAGLFAAAAGVKLGHVLHVEDVNADDGERRDGGYVPDLDMSEDEALHAAPDLTSCIDCPL